MHERLRSITQCNAEILSSNSTTNASNVSTIKILNDHILFGSTALARVEKWRGACSLRKMKGTGLISQFLCRTQSYSRREHSELFNESGYSIIFAHRALVWCESTLFQLYFCQNREITTSKNSTYLTHGPKFYHVCFFMQLIKTWRLTLRIFCTTEIVLL